MRIMIERIDLTPCMKVFEFSSSDMLRLVYQGKRGMDKYVPKDTGFLRGNSYPTAPDTLTYAADYAEYVRNMSGVNWTTPGTRGDWIEYYNDQGAPEVVEEAERIVSERS